MNARPPARATAVADSMAARFMVLSNHLSAVPARGTCARGRRIAWAGWDSRRSCRGRRRAAAAVATRVAHIFFSFFCPPARCPHASAARVPLRRRTDARARSSSSGACRHRRQRRAASSFGATVRGRATLLACGCDLRRSCDRSQRLLSLLQPLLPLRSPHCCCSGSAAATGCSCLPPQLAPAPT